MSARPSPSGHEFHLNQRRGVGAKKPPVDLSLRCHETGTTRLLWVRPWGRPAPDQPGSLPRLCLVQLRPARAARWRAGFDRPRSVRPLLLTMSHEWSRFTNRSNDNDQANCINCLLGVLPIGPRQRRWREIHLDADRRRLGQQGWHGFSISCDAVPLQGRIVMRKITERTSDAKTVGGQQ